MTRRHVALSLVAVIGLLAVTLTGLGYLRWRQQQQTQATQTALEVGKESLAQLLSYDYRSLDADLGRSQERLTKDFAADFAQVADRSVRPAAVKDKVVTSASVAASSVVSTEADSVKLLMFVDQITSSSKDQNVISQSRVVVTMQQEDDAWRIADVRAL